MSSSQSQSQLSSSNGRRQAPGGNSTFNPGWTSENDIIKPSRKPGPNNPPTEEENVKIHKKQVNIEKEDNYQIGWESTNPSSPIKPARRPGPPQNESKEMSSPKKRPGTGGAASFSVGWVKPDANAKQSQVGIPVGGHSTFSVGWTGVPEAIKLSRKPPPSQSCKETSVFKENSGDANQSSLEVKSLRKHIPQDNSDGYSISWNDQPNNQTIRPSRKPGPPSPVRPEKDTNSAPSPTKKRVAGGEASFSVGWTTPNTQTDRFLTSHRQAPGGNSTFTTSWETTTNGTKTSEPNLNTETDDIDETTPEVIKDVPYTIGVIVHLPKDSSTSTTLITETLLPIIYTSLTLSGISNTNIFIEYINSLTALPFTTQKLLSRVDGILVFSISIIDPNLTPSNKLLESSILIEVLQNISNKYNYPAIVPGFLMCLNSPESILEMKGVMKHISKDWSTHLVTILETINSKPPVTILSIEEYFKLKEPSQLNDDNESITESEDSNLTTTTTTTTNNNDNKNIAGKLTSTEPNTKVAGASKKRITGGGASTIVLG